MEFFLMGLKNVKYFFSLILTIRVIWMTTEKGLQGN